MKRKIKWTRSDIARLSNAVRTFNKEVEKAMETVDKKALPKLIDYQEMKSKIVSRRDLNLALSTLKKIKNKNAFDLEVSVSNPNVKYIHWTKMTAKSYDTRHRKNMQEEIKKIKEAEVKFGTPTEINGQIVIKAQMGSPREKQLEGYLNVPNFRLLETANTYERFNELLDRINRLAYDSSKINMSELYKKNYLQMFEGYEGFDKYDEVVKKLQEMKGEEFYEVLKRIDENYDDFDYHYGNRMTEAEFNEFASRLGINIDDVEDYEDTLF